VSLKRFGGALTMPRNELASHAFDPEILSALCAAIDDAITVLGAQLDDSNRQRVHEAIAIAVIDLAKAGQRDPERLSRYAIDKGRQAVSSVTLR
jgi:hypothetical protein